MNLPLGIIIKNINDDIEEEKDEEFEDCEEVTEVDYENGSEEGFDYTYYIDELERNLHSLPSYHSEDDDPSDIINDYERLRRYVENFLDDVTGDSNGSSY